ncbi:hypothetical protein D0Z00_001858 [Geotrichum galactomycetum]|uniref:Uncharacterized protein n=1 Tax=Geotrichum galactomycetum TaxID=27317 RepID=A0ACB6V5Q9_9ASCO|nr:hypothetical protein D0Z00_001858 [Geotrichum candidum]
MCCNRACSVDTLDDDEIPAIWRQPEAGIAEGSYGFGYNDMFGLPSSLEYSASTSGNDNDYCELDKYTDKGVYVSLAANPERFTGYAGPNANILWSSFYDEDCFSNTNMAGDDMEDSATTSEQRLFRSIISGFHASVSTHLCYSYLNQTTQEWGPNQKCFEFRVGNFPDRLNSLYFNYALVARALVKLGEQIERNEIELFDQPAAITSKAKLLELIEALKEKPSDNLSTKRHLFDEKRMFQTFESQLLKRELRKRFYKISQLVDCVGCDRCRLWAKVQITGYATALKLVFEEHPTESANVAGTRLSKSEVAALVNTFNKISHSVQAVDYFRSLRNSQST